MIGKQIQNILKYVALSMVVSVLGFFMVDSVNDSPKIASADIPPPPPPGDGACTGDGGGGDGACGGDAGASGGTDGDGGAGGCDGACE